MAVNLGITPRDFWKMTFVELWAVFDAKNPKYADRMTVEDVHEMARAIDEKIRAKEGLSQR